MELDLECVASFVKLAGLPHYNRAAAEQNLTTSALSKRILRLETQLGVSLLVRGPTGVLALTSAGKRFIGEADALLKHAHAARARTRGDSDQDSLVLGVVGQIGDYPTRPQLWAVASQLRHNRPRTRLRCRPVAFTELSRCLTEGWVDVLFTAAAGVTPGVHFTPLNTFDRVGIVSARHDLADAGEIAVEQFAGERMLYAPNVDAEWMRLWYLGDVRARNESDLVSIMPTDHATMLRHVAAGTGVTTTISALSRAAAPDLRSVRLIGCPSAYYGACRREDDHRERVTALIADLQRLFKLCP